MSQVLELKFNTANGKTMTIAVNDPKSTLTASEISSAMQTIIAQDIFHNEGNDLVSINQARLIDRNVSDINLAQ